MVFPTGACQRDLAVGEDSVRKTASVRTSHENPSAEWKYEWLLYSGNPVVVELGKLACLARQLLAR